MTHGHPDDHHNQRHGDEDHTRVVVVGGVTPTTIEPDDAAAAGSSITAAAADHKHAIVAAVAGTSLPLDAAAEGAATSFARSDHKHAREGWAHAIVDTNQTTTSTTYTDLTTPGPAVTLTTGTAAKVTVTSYVSNSVTGNGALVSFAITGASSVSTSDSYALGSSGAAGHYRLGSRVFVVTGLTAGSNTFTSKYRADTGGTATFVFRNILVERIN